jgi:hypothetical protein
MAALETRAVIDKQWRSARRARPYDDEFIPDVITMRSAMKSKIVVQEDGAGRGLAAWRLAG